MAARSVLAVHPAQREDMEDLVTRRPQVAMDRIDPFLMINHHGPQTYPPNNYGLPFGPHPHRGFETVTFILAGELAHKDNTGHESIIGPGGVQWMTAGAGIVHSEMSPANFLRDGGPLEILQLWLNLPARLKMSRPGYVGLQADQIPAIDTGHGAVVHLIAGEYDGHHGPIRSLTGVMMAMVEMKAATALTLPVPSGRGVFLYDVQGEVRIGGASVPPMSLVELDREGDHVHIHAVTDAFLLFGHGDVIGEKVVGYGPFVMNSQAEIQQAIRDFQTGKFG
jgi:redox-sensitive bicupin YhaK (pirin superfamily)